MTRYSCITGTGSYLPPRRLTNADLVAELATQGVETSDEWIVERTGIRARHFAAPDVCSSDLGFEAAKKALEAAGLGPQDIDLIVVATSTPDMVFPSVASILQHKLAQLSDEARGIAGCPAFDVQAVCSGFVYALTVADAMVQTGAANKVLVVGAEVFSRILDFKDRTTCVLFGDGAGAVVLGASDEPGIIGGKLQADGAHLGLLKVPAHMAGGEICGNPYVEMDGPGVFKFAVKTLAKVAEEVIAEAGIGVDEIDWIVPHQANKRIIESTAKHLGLSMDKVVLTVDEHANTSAASIPLTLDTGIRRGQIQRGQTLLLEDIGGGFAWGAVLLRY